MINRVSNSNSKRGVDSIDRSHIRAAASWMNAKKLAPSLPLTWGDFSKMSKFIEEPLDHVAFAIQCFDPVVLLGSVAFVGNVGDRTLFADMLRDPVGVVGVFGNHIGSIVEVFEQE
jgi:hypothetical protein